MPKKLTNQNRVMACVTACNQAAQARATLRDAIQNNTLSQEEQDMLDLLKPALGNTQANGRKAKKGPEYDATNGSQDPGKENEAQTKPV